MGPRRQVWPLLAAALVLATAVAPAPVAGQVSAPSDEHADAAPLQRGNGTVQTAHDLTVQQVSRDAVTVDQTFRLTPDDPGTVVVVQEYAIPDRVATLRTRVPAEAEVRNRSGFTPGRGTRYWWDGSSTTATLTYELPVNRTLSAPSPHGNESSLAAVDAGEWALFGRPNAPTHYTYRGDAVQFRQTTHTDGPGAVGEWLVFLGAHETYERTANGQRFQLVVPAAANMTAPPGRALNTLARASNALRVGDRDDRVFVVAAPASVEWGRVMGARQGDADMWVRADQPVDDPTNAWVHEYVHTRQDFETSAELSWVREATASYYAALYSYEQGRISFSAFRARLAEGTHPRYNGTVLTNRSTYNGTDSYDKGALALARIDRRIRVVTEQNRSFQAVFRSMNEADATVSLTEFLSFVGRASNASVIDPTQRYVSTTSDPAVWNETAHERVFGPTPPRVGVQSPANGSATYRVSGPYRTATLQSNSPVVVVPGERLTVPAAVTNAGGRTGTYSARLRVNGSVVDRATGTVEPNTTVSVPLDHTFAKPGRYVIRLDDERIPVVVEEPATATVTEFSVQPNVVREGETVTVTAVVANDASVPARRHVVVTRNYQTIRERQVALGPNETRTVSVQVFMSEPGSHLLSVGGARPVDVLVRERETPTPSPSPSPTPTASPTPSPTTTAADGDGFGIAVVALALSLVALWRRRCE